MASDVLIVLLKLNLAGAAATLLVLALRAPIRRVFGARVAYALWIALPVAALAVMLPARTTPIEMTATVATTLAPSAPAATPAAEAAAAPAFGETPFDLSPVVLAVWLAGVIAAIALLVSRQRAFIASLGRLSREQGAPRALRAEAHGIGPALIGALFPKLILPHDFETRFDAVERDVVLAHEDVHLRGRDPLINACLALAQCLNWFNPLLHVAAHKFRIDQELACDAAVIARFPSERRRYAEAMLKTQLAPARLPLGCYWPARGEHPLKQRILMLKRDLPSEFRAAWGTLAALVLAASAGAAAWSAQPPREVEATAISYARSETDDQLLQAVWRGDSRRAEAALAAGADPNTRASDGMAVLVIAARADDLPNLNLLLRHGADPNLTSPGEGNALAAAARRGQIRSVVALVDHGARIDDMAPGIGTPLAASVRTGRLDVVKYLVEQGADVNLPSPPQAPWDRWAIQRKPLDWALNGDHDSIASYLRSRGATM